MNQNFPTSFIFYFYGFLGDALVLSTILLGMSLYRYKFPNKIMGKRSRPKKYIIYSIYLNFVNLIIELFVLLYSIMNFNQLSFASVEFYLWYPVIALDVVVILSNLILELIYHLYWKQDFLNSQQEGGK